MGTSTSIEPSLSLSTVTGVPSNSWCIHLTSASSGDPGMGAACTDPAEPGVGALVAGAGMVLVVGGSLATRDEDEAGAPDDGRQGGETQPARKSPVTTAAATSLREYCFFMT
jgi:hypothetical protein